MIYRNRYINLISFFVSVVIFLVLNFCFLGVNTNPVENLFNIISDIKNEKEQVSSELLKDEVIELGNWYVEIPKINLKAPIAEGTDMDTLKAKVGHFSETSKTEGNVGLAAHNRGYENNFFENLKKVNIDDEIIYIYENYKKTYVIDKIEIIKNTDWSYLEKSEENKITLITCVENEPLYRRCVQATELEF